MVEVAGLHGFRVSLQVITTCLSAANKPSDQRADPGEQRPGNLRKNQDAEWPQKPAANHHKKRDRGNQQEGGHHHPPSLAERKLKIISHHRFLQLIPDLTDILHVVEPTKSKQYSLFA